LCFSPYTHTLESRINAHFANTHKQRETKGRKWNQIRGADSEKRGGALYDRK